MTSLPEPEPGRQIARAAGFVLAVLFAFVFGIMSCINQNSAFDATVHFLALTTQVFEQFENSNLRPIFYLQPARRPGDGVTINEVGNDGNLVLMTSFWDGQTELRLIKRDGTIVAKWPVLHSSFFNEQSGLGETLPETDRNVDLHGALMEPDGSVIFNFEYAGTVKLSRCGDLVWRVAHPTHHSVEHSEKGGYWIPGRRFIEQGSTDPDEQFEPYTKIPHEGHIFDDLILHVSDKGEILERKSVMRIFYDSGMEPQMTGTGDSFQRDGVVRPELVHLNKIAELPSAYAAAFPMFKAGDLLISLRQHNMLAVIDPDTWRVKWFQVGPYIRQHDPHWNPDGTITIFDNDGYRTSFAYGDTIDVNAPQESKILKLDPKTGKTSLVYGTRPGEEFSTIIRGQIDPSPYGGYLTTEFEGGRVFEFDKTGHIVWEYMNRYDADTVTEITGARLYPESFFNVKDWTCPAR